MLEVNQTRLGGVGPDGFPESLPKEQHGDCFAACVASILELDIEEFGEDRSPVTLEKGDRWNRVLERFGYWIHATEWIDWLWEQIPDDAYWIAAVPSQNLGCYPDDGRPIRHAVVVKGREIAWDPSLAKKYEPRTLLGREGEHDVIQPLAASFLIRRTP